MVNYCFINVIIMKNIEYVMYVLIQGHILIWYYSYKYFKGSCTGYFFNIYFLLSSNILSGGSTCIHAYMKYLYSLK